MLAGLLLILLLPLLLAAAFLLGRHWQRRQRADDFLSAVSRQHIEIFQGAQLNEAQLEAAKDRFRRLLERGEVSTIEASLRPGMSYVFHVRALAEIGTDEAGRILERQLQRHLSDDQMEQAWYWIDLASGLRSLNRSESLPHLLRCAEEAGEIPLGHFFAAETVCFLGFSGYTRQFDSPLGRSAVRTLLRAVEGLRYGVQPVLVADARLGEVIESLWDHRPSRPHPLLARLLVEVRRWNRRAERVQKILDDRADQEAFSWQMARLEALEPAFQDYLRDAATDFLKRLPTTTEQELPELLDALGDLRAEAGREIMALLQRPYVDCADTAIDVLVWSRDARVGPWLCDWIERRISPSRRAQWRRRSQPPKHPSVPADIPYRAVLHVLRNHPSAKSEALLLAASRDWDPIYRAAAYGSLGWYTPMRQLEVIDALNQGRRDPCLEVRRFARAALARLGERQSLQWFRQALMCEDPHQVHDAIQLIASEGLTLLWPDLDRLADAEDPEISLRAQEALERLFEEMDWQNQKGG
jgi:hypothetical protein